MRSFREGRYAQLRRVVPGQRGVAEVSLRPEPRNERAAEIPIPSSRPPSSDVTPSPIDQSNPMWLIRGLMDYLSKTVGIETGFYDDIAGEGFFSGLLSDVDRLCAQRATTREGAAILPHIGAFIRPAELYGAEADKYSPPFNACATSFTEYLIERIGLPATINLFPLIDKMETEILRLTDQSIATLRGEWLRKIGIAP
jgi:hypothetical protein